jgi:hypothetical protein
VEVAMEKIDLQLGNEKLNRLKTELQVDVLTGWGVGGAGGEGESKSSTWSLLELDRLHTSLSLLTVAMGGAEKFIRNLNGVTVKKANIGSHGGEALDHRVSFSEKGSFGAWTVIHEFAHAWDANHGWGLSRQLEKYTGGFTSPLLSFAKRALGFSDSAFRNSENKPGRRGRKPGCNAAGYFYGDKPSGSNWRFNRVEDFAESVAMYIGWEKENDLSQHARDRIVRYTFNDGDRDAFNVSDTWTVYRKYFYPEGGDYTKSLRWKFVEELMNE